MTLGQKIREARISRHMTQQDVAGDMITRNMLSKIENDSATPSVRTLTHIAGALGLPPGAFLEGSEEESDKDSVEAWLTLAEASQDAGRNDEKLIKRAEQRMAWLETRLALLRAYVLIEQKAYDDAFFLLEKTEQPPEGREEPYYAAMEICCRERRDFEGAYRCAARRLALSQKGGTQEPG